MDINCNWVIFSWDSPLFSIHRSLKYTHGENTVYIWLPLDCEQQENLVQEHDTKEWIFNPECGHLAKFWTTSLMRRGSCLEGRACVSTQKTAEVKDVGHLEIDCGM